MLSKDIIDNMQHIVDNCMGEDIAACTTKCPMHCDAKKYIHLIHENKGAEAISVIRETLFTPGILGRICAHPCESACRRGKEDDPLSIAKLKRYAADNFDKIENWDLSKKVPTGKKVAIIGCGPAGAQAAYHLSKEGHSVVVFDKNNAVGGAMYTGIPEYRLPRDVINHEFSFLTQLGVTIKLNTEIGKDIFFDDLKKDYDAVLIAVGKQLGRVDTSLKNHDALGIISAIDFLKSVSLTKSCDNIGKTITVVGGGDVAMDCARSALRLPQVEKVRVVCLEDSYDTMTASHIEIHEALEEGIAIHNACGIQEIITSNGTVSHLKLKKCISIFNEQKQFNPTFDISQITEFDTDSIIFAVGQGLDTSFDPQASLPKKKNGTFDADPVTLQVGDSKLFIAGDCASAVIVVGAMAEGKKAGISINRFLQKIDLKVNRIAENESGYDTKLFLPQEYLPKNWNLPEKIARNHPSITDPKIRKTNFKEVERTYTTEEAHKESNRCLQCECKLCMKECLMLSKYTSCPKALFTEYLEKGYEAMETKIAFSCNDCNQCTLRCPHDFNIQDNFIDMRRDYVEKLGGYSNIKTHIALDDDQELECSPKYSFNIVTKKRPKYVFIPGCTVPASLPGYVEKVVNHLSETLGEEVSTILQCCGRPTQMIGQMDVFLERYNRVQHEIDTIDAETIITVCPSCNKTYDRYSGKKLITYWELMRDVIGIPKGQANIGINSDVIFNIHDPCVTRTKSEHHESIRWVLEQLGYPYEEMTYIKDNTRCCGVGGMLNCVDPELHKQYNLRRMDDATQDHIVTYCGSCRGSMEKGGKDGLHILQLLFDPKPYMKSDACLRGADYGFHNRMDTKERLIKISQSLNIH